MLGNPPGAPKAWLLGLFFSSGSYLVRILQKPTPEIACSKNVDPRIDASGEVGGRLLAPASSMPWGVWCEFGVPTFPWALRGAGRTARPRWPLPGMSVCFSWGLGRLKGASQVALVVKSLSASAGDVRDSSSIPGSGRSPGGGHGNPLQYSHLEDAMDRGATVPTAAESQMRLKQLSTEWQATETCVLSLC